MSVANALRTCDAPDTAAITASMAADCAALRRLAAIARWVSRGSDSGAPTDLVGVIIEYANIQLLMDVNALYFASRELRARGEQVKEYILRDAAFGTYVGGLWTSMKQWLAEDLRRPASSFHRAVAGAGGWVGQQLAQDAELRRALTLQMEEAARGMAPDFAEFLTVHIRDTIRNWDAHDMAEQIELNIGKDLQAIRINGTVVGGAIGLALHLLTYVPGFFAR